jgi:hypothetical protein
MKRVRILVLVLIILGVILSSVLAAPHLVQSATRSRQVVSTGYTLVSVGQVTLRGTLGQPIAGDRVQGDTTLHQGFWYGVESMVDWLIHLPLVLKQ